MNFQHLCAGNLIKGFCEEPRKAENWKAEPKSLLLLAEFERQQGLLHGFLVSS
jgi:hypothetical protein